MGQIEKKKKGRPSKADLARRMSMSPATQGFETRRSLRPRNVMYNFDFYDYLDEEDEDEVDIDERRGDKKLKTVLKLNQNRARADPSSRRRGRPPSARGKHASEEEGEEDGGFEEEEEDGTEGEGKDAEEEIEDESVKRPVKKRKINVQESKDSEEEELVDDEDDGEVCID